MLNYLCDVRMKMIETFEEDMNISIIEYEEIRGRFIGVSNMIEEMDTLAEIREGVGKLKTVLEFLFNVRKLNTRQIWELDEMAETMLRFAEKDGRRSGKERRAAESD